MLIDSLAQELSHRLGQQIAVLFRAKPAIDAAERLADKLTRAGLDAHAVGHLCLDACTAAVISRDDPDAVEQALVLQEIGFVLIDAGRTLDYITRTLRVRIDGQQILLTIHHHVADAALPCAA